MQTAVHLSRPVAGLACCPAQAAKAANFTEGATRTSADSHTRWQVWQTYLVSRTCRTARGLLHILQMLLAVIVSACGRVVWQHSCTRHVKQDEQSTSNHTGKTNPPYKPKESIVMSRTGSKSGGLAATDSAKPKQGQDEVRVPSGPPTGGEPTYGTKP